MSRSHTGGNGRSLDAAFLNPITVSQQITGGPQVGIKRLVVCADGLEAGIDFDAALEDRVSLWVEETGIEPIGPLLGNSEG